jgi:hypothetical protein
MSEAQIGYVIDCLRIMRKRHSRVMEVKAETQQRFVDELRKRLAGIVWESGGCPQLVSRRPDRRKPGNLAGISDHLQTQNARGGGAGLHFE